MGAKSINGEGVAQDIFGIRTGGGKSYVHSVHFSQVVKALSRLSGNGMVLPLP
jgi:hypothetical protein